MDTPKDKQNDLPLVGSYNLRPFLIKTLHELNITHFNHCQAETFPCLQKKRNLICCYPTGTGKTLAFLLPILNQYDFQIPGPYAIIFCPTQELAAQTYQVAQQFSKNCSQPLKLLLATSKTEINVQKNKFDKQKSHIMIGTPKRIISLWRDFQVPITQANTFIFDEADMLLKSDFWPDIEALLKKKNNKTQISLFSSTLNEDIENFSKKFLFNPLVVRAQTFTKKTPYQISHFLVPVKQDNKIAFLLNFLKTIQPFLVLIFFNKKADLIKAYQIMKQEKYHVALLHGELNQRTRQQMLKKIKAHNFIYVLCSDVASRGLDIQNVSHVISVDIPKNYNFYLHRAGRTGRHNTGYSYFFYQKPDPNFKAFLTKNNISYENLKLVDGQTKVIEQKALHKNKIKHYNYKLAKVFNQYKDHKKHKPNYKKRRQKKIERIFRKAKKS